MAPSESSAPARSTTAGASPLPADNCFRPTEPDGPWGHGVIHSQQRLSNGVPSHKQLPILEH